MQALRLPGDACYSKVWSWWKDPVVEFRFSSHLFPRLSPFRTFIQINTEIRPPFMFLEENVDLHMCSVNVSVSCLDCLCYGIFLLTGILPGTKADGWNLHSCIQFVRCGHIMTIALTIINFRVFLWESIWLNICNKKTRRDDAEGSSIVSGFHSTSMTCKWGLPDFRIDELFSMNFLGQTAC